MRTRIGPGRELLGRRDGGGERGGRGGEGDEERVALRVDLDAAAGAEGGAQDAPVLGERVGVALGAERVQELRRALDVGEEERHRPGGQCALHRGIMHGAARRGCPAQWLERANEAFAAGR